MAVKKREPKSKARRPAPIMHIGTGLDNEHVKFLITMLSKSLELAIVTGRTEVGIALAERLGKLGDVHDVTVQNCNLGCTF